MIKMVSTRRTNEMVWNDDRDDNEVKSWDDDGMTNRSGEADCKHAEVPLQPRIDGEGTSSGVHWRHVLHVVDVLQTELCAVVPVHVIHVLSGSYKECFKVIAETVLGTELFWFSIHYTWLACAAARYHTCRLQACSCRQWSRSTLKKIKRREWLRSTD